MKVRIADVDSKMANIALMKIARFHKERGHNVEWHNPLVDKNVDRLYVTKLFDFTEEYQYCDAGEVLLGGTGYDITSKLPDEIESVRNIDYTIYQNCDYSMQFYSRGCIRNCPFCIVQRKEGRIVSVEPMDLNPKGNHIEILDNNFFANSEWKWAISDLKQKNQKVNFHGVDARIMNEEQAFNLNSLKHNGYIHIAWDNPKDDLEPKLREITKYIKPYKLMCYVLIGYWSTLEEDLYRVEKLREIGIDPFVMPYNKEEKYQNRFARWVNHKATFKTVTWKEYRA